MINVTVTAADIADGKANDCFRCPVALAVARATGDSEANVYERDWEFWIEAHGRNTKTPCCVADFVSNFDRKEDGEPLPSSFSFSLPDWGDWLERCYRCESFCSDDELDDDGVCEECKP